MLSEQELGRCRTARRVMRRLQVAGRRVCPFSIEFSGVAAEIWGKALAGLSCSTFFLGKPDRPDEIPLWLVGAAGEKRQNLRMRSAAERRDVGDAARIRKSERRIGKSGE